MAGKNCLGEYILRIFCPLGAMGADFLAQKSAHLSKCFGATRRIRTEDLLITNKPEVPNIGHHPEQSSTNPRKSGG